MTRREVEQWLAVRTPAPPAAVAERLAHVLATCPPERLAGSATLKQALGTLGVLALDSLAGRPLDAEDTALDLLVADAFVTYAFEAAAESGREVSPLAASILQGVRA